MKLLWKLFDRWDWEKERLKSILQWQRGREILKLEHWLRKLLARISFGIGMLLDLARVLTFMNISDSGFYRYQGGTEACISRALAYAPYADLLWYSHPFSFLIPGWRQRNPCTLKQNNSPRQSVQSTQNNG